MGIGQVISDTFGMVKSRFGQLLGVWAIYFGITLLLTVALGVGVGVTGVAGLAAMESNPLAAGGGMILVIAVFYIGYLLLTMAQYASLITMASPLRQTTVGEALGAGWRAAPALLLLIIVMIVCYVVVVLILSLLGAAFSALGELGSGLFGFLALGVMVWVGCRLAPLFAVIAVDGVRNPFKAIGRSWALSSGHALTIFFASLVFMVLLIVIAAIALLPSIGLLRTMMDPTGLAGPAAAPAMGGIALMMVGFLIVGVLFNVIYCAFLAVIHSSLTNAAGEGTAEAFA